MGKLTATALRILFLSLLILFFVNSAVADDILQDRLANIHPRDARWALVAVDLQTGREIAGAGTAAKAPLEPASLVKLITTGAVLDRIERHDKWDITTKILSDAVVREGTLHGDLYLAGRGNAFLSSADMEKIAGTLAENGIRRITGDIITDDSFFETRGMERSRNGAGYAPPEALGLDLHTVALTVSSSDPGKPPQVLVEPPNDTVRLAIDARTVAIMTNSIKVTQLDDASYRVSGNIIPGSPPVRWRFSLSAPALYAGGALRACLGRGGVETKGAVRKGKAPATAHSLAEIEGPALIELVREMNVNSLNVMADNLLLWLGAERFGAPGTREKGLLAIKEFLSTLDLPKGEVSITDGSGLREDNRLMARFLAEYLRKVAQKRWFADFRDSLPRAGMDGTLREIGFKDERFRVKSGRLENAFALAGYGVDGMGKEIAFAYIVNVPHGALLNLEKSGAEVIRLLSELKQN